MCATSEGRVLSIEGDSATVETGGRRQTAIALLVPDLRPGERVLLGLGMVLRRLEPGERVIDPAIEAAQLVGAPAGPRGAQP